MNDAAETEPIRPATVHRAYGRAAAGFDSFVGSIPGYHDHLRMSTTRMGLSGGSDLRLLDIGCGTGASTAALLDAAPGAEVVAVDASTNMLAVARKKNWPPRVQFVHARLETLAEAGVEGPFDGVFAAYLVSNLPDAEIGLRRLLSLLKPGAPLAVHDYAVADKISSRMRWSMLSWAYLIPMARMRSGSADLQRYRSHQVRTEGVESVTHRMQRAGFEDVRVQTVSGLQQHLVYTFLGRRPDEPDVVAQRQAERRAARRADAEAAAEQTAEQEAPGPDDAGGADDPGYAADGDTGATGGSAKPGKDWTPGKDGTAGTADGASGSTAANESAGPDDADTPPTGSRTVGR